MAFGIVAMKRNEIKAVNWAQETAISAYIFSYFLMLYFPHFLSPVTPSSPNFFSDQGLSTVSYLGRPIE